MTKRLFNSDTYKVNTDRGDYAVVLERLKNDVNGNPRFEAYIVVLEVFGEHVSPEYYFTAHYRFSGHYMNAQDEAKWIVHRYEEDLKTA